MMPTMRQLEAFVLVYRLGSLTKAAAELRVTQSDPADRGEFSAQTARPNHPRAASDPRLRRRGADCGTYRRRRQWARPAYAGPARGEGWPDCDCGVGGGCLGITPSNSGAV